MKTSWRLRTYLLLIYTFEILGLMGAETVFNIDIMLDGQARELIFHPSDDLSLIAMDFVRKHNINGVPSSDGSCYSTVCFHATIMEAMEARVQAERAALLKPTTSNKEPLADLKREYSQMQPRHPEFVSSMRSSHAREAQVHPEHQAPNSPFNRVGYFWRGTLDLSVSSEGPCICILLTCSPRLESHL
jgi:hypothetical protein